VAGAKAGEAVRTLQSEPRPSSIAVVGARLAVAVAVFAVEILRVEL
jgi:hypothetical protein